MSKKGLGKFVAGAAVGAGLGILFAPKKGTEIRKELKEKIEMFHDVVRFEKQLDWDIDVFYTKLKSLYESTSKPKTD